MNPEYFYIVNDGAFGPYATALQARNAAEKDGHTRYHEVLITRLIARSHTETVFKTTWGVPYDLHDGFYKEEDEL